MRTTMLTFKDKTSRISKSPVSGTLYHNLVVDSPCVKYMSDYIESKYEYQSTELEQQGDTLIAKPTTTQYEFRTSRKVPRLGVMLVGWGGNNGSTLTAGVLANKQGISWQTKEGKQQERPRGDGRGGGARAGVRFDGVQPERQRSRPQPRFRADGGPQAKDRARRRPGEEEGGVLLCPGLDRMCDDLQVLELSGRGVPLQGRLRVPLVAASTEAEVRGDPRAQAPWRPVDPPLGEQRMQVLLRAWRVLHQEQRLA